MRFLANRSDGSIIGRFADDKLTFPIPSNLVVYECPTDISEKDLPNGSSLSTFEAAKIVSLRSLHSSFLHTLSSCEEMIVSNCDSTLSSLVTYGPGKITQIRPGGKLISNTITNDSVVTVCMRYYPFIMGSPINKPNLRYYNYDEITQSFITPPDLSVKLVDATSPSLVLATITSDVEIPIGHLPDFRVSVENLGSVPVYLSGWVLISRFGIPSGGGGTQVLSFYPTSSLIECGLTVTDPTFTASYSSAPDLITIDDGLGPQPVPLPGTSITCVGTYSKDIPGEYVSFTLTARKNGQDATSNTAIYWTRYRRYGVGAAGQSSETFIKSLTGSLGLDRTYGTPGFHVNAGPTDKIYYAHLSSYGTATFWVGGFSGGFTHTATVSVTENGLSADYNLYESDQVDLGDIYVIVT